MRTYSSVAAHPAAFAVSSTYSRRVASSLSCTARSNVRTVPASCTSPGNTLNEVPPWMRVIDSTAVAVGSMRRATSVCAPVTICAAQSTVSEARCGCAAWPPCAAYGDREAVGRAHDGTRARGDGAGRQCRPVVQAVNLGAGKSLEEAVVDHRLRSGQPFLRRLKEQVHAPVEVSRLGEITRGAKQHRHVAVMSAAVGDARVNAGMRGAGCLLDRQCVHVGPQADGLARGAGGDDAHDSRLADALVHFDAPLPQEPGDHRGGAILAIGELGMPVQIPAHLAHLRRQLLDAGQERGGLRWRGLAGAHRGLLCQSWELLESGPGRIRTYDQGIMSPLH